MKILCIGDLHIGEKGNSPKFQEQVLEFIDWAIQLGYELGVDRVVQFGDYFHTRHKIDVSSLNVGIEAAVKLSGAFGRERVIVLKGNHDLYYLDSLEVSSVNVLDPYVTVVGSSWVCEDESLMYVPWVTDGKMFDDVVQQSIDHQIDYILGHFEFEGFEINDGYEMKHGVSHREFRDAKRVVSGHYHSSQQKDNVTYLGTPYPITMSEANEAHGVFLLDTETDELTFFEYEKVKVLSLPYDQVLEMIESGDLDPSNTSIRVEYPDDLEDETVIDEISNILTELSFSDVKVKYTGKKAQEIMGSDIGVQDVEDIDELVLIYIEESAEVPGVDKEMLASIYKKAIEAGEQE